MVKQWRPDIFEYLDYRQFLQDYYRAGKEHQRAFSYRYLARRAGFSSPNFIKLVMDGSRNLGGDSPQRVARAFDLDGEETRFFVRLVAFGQADSTADKNEAYGAVAACRRFREARKIEHDTFEYLSHWYFPAIREMAARDDFRDDPGWISEQLWPTVPVREVKSALATLFRLELLVRDDDGRVRRGDPSVTTGHEVAALAARNYHYEMLARARDSVEGCTRDHRDISALTVCVNGETIPLLKERIHRFRETMLDLCDSSDGPDTVYQLNIQLFPLTRTSS